jgi:hypothetical protein
MDKPPRRRRPSSADLAEPFETLHNLPGKTKRDGTPLTYLTGAQVAQRLNRVLGFDHWSFEIVETQFDQPADEVIVRGRLTIYCGRRTVVREQFGSQRHNRLRESQAIIDSGFDHKGAATDALKKCATLVGVGLYLYGPESEERPAEWEAEEWASQATHAPRPAVSRPAAPRQPAAPAAAPRQPAAQQPAPASQAPAGAPAVTDKERDLAKKAAQSVYIWAHKYQGLDRTAVLGIFDLTPDEHLHWFMLQHGYTPAHVIAALQQRAELGRIDWAAIVQEQGLRRVK